MLEFLTRFESFPFSELNEHISISYFPYYSSFKGLPTMYIIFILKTTTSSGPGIILDTSKIQITIASHSLPSLTGSHFPEIYEEIVNKARRIITLNSEMLVPKRVYRSQFLVSAAFNSVEGWVK
jgi:hypothetical protein